MSRITMIIGAVAAVLIVALAAFVGTWLSLAMGEWISSIADKTTIALWVALFMGVITAIAAVFHLTVWRRY